MVLPGTTPGAPRGMMDFLISTAAGFGLVVGFIFLVFVTIFLVGAWFCIIDATIERPNRLTNVRIRKRIVELMASGFAPPLAHIYGGAGVAVDGAGKRVFLANAKVMKLYGIEDVINVESDFADEFPPKTSAIRLWVRDLESPFFEIKDMTSTKLRQIDSLLSVMLESRAADANSLLPQSVLFSSLPASSAVKSSVRSGLTGCVRQPLQSVSERVAEDR